MANVMPTMLTNLTVPDVSGAVCGLDILEASGWQTMARQIVRAFCMQCAQGVVSVAKLKSNLSGLLTDLKPTIASGFPVYTGRERRYTRIYVQAVELEIALNHELWDLHKALERPEAELVASKDTFQKIYDVVYGVYEKQKENNRKAAHASEDFSALWFKMTD